MQANVIYNPVKAIDDVRIIYKTKMSSYENKKKKSR